jgi:hypothetical protein
MQHIAPSQGSSGQQHNDEGFPENTMAIVRGDAGLRMTLQMSKLLDKCPSFLQKRKLPAKDHSATYSTPHTTTLVHRQALLAHLHWQPFCH